MPNRPIFLEFTVQDADGEKASIRMLQSLADTTTIATLLTSAAGLASDIDEVLDGKVVSYSVGVKLPTAGGSVKASPVAGCEIERCGLFTCDLVSSLSVDSLVLPALMSTLYDNNSVLIGPTTPLGILLASWDNAPFINKYEVLHGGNVLNAVKVFRKHRMQTKRARAVTS